MSRDLEQYNIAESQENDFRRVSMVKIALESGTARFHDGIGEIRLENLLQYSEQLSTSASSWWSEQLCTVTDNDTTAPDGTSTADYIVPDNGTTAGQIFRAVTFEPEEVYTASLFVKSDGVLDQFRIFSNNRDGDTIQVDFDVAAGTVDTAVRAIGGIEDVGDGWYLCWCSWNSLGSASGSQTLRFRVNESGNGTNGLYYWGASLVKGGYAGYYPVTDESKAPETFIGVGSIGAVSSVRVSPELRPIAVQITIADIPANVVYEILNQDHYGREVEVYSCFCDESGKPLTKPGLDWSGFIDKFDATTTENSGNITVTCESKFALWDKAILRRYTDIDQQIEYPGDLFFEFLPQMMELELEWGGRRTSTGSSFGGVNGGNFQMFRAHNKIGHKLDAIEGGSGPGVPPMT